MHGRLPKIKVKKNSKSYRPNEKRKNRVTTYTNAAKSKFKVLKSPRLTDVSQLGKRERREIEERTPLHEATAAKILSKIKCSCSQPYVHNNEKLGCAFAAIKTESNIPDLAATVRGFLDCRDMVLRKTRIERDHFMQKRFFESVASKIETKLGKTKYVMNYLINGNKVCKHTYAKFHDVTKQRVDLMWNSKKEMN